MRLRPATDCPPAARTAAVTRLGELISWGQVKIAADGLTLSMPHRVFFLRRRRLSDSGSLRGITEPGGWRFLLRWENNEVAALQTWEQDSRWRLSTVKMGSWATISISDWRPR